VSTGKTAFGVPMQTFLRETHRRVARSSDGPPGHSMGWGGFWSATSRGHLCLGSRVAKRRRPYRVAAVDLSHVNCANEGPIDLILGYITLSQAHGLFDLHRRRWAISKRLGFQ
jgi:hypothetical protein